MFRYAAAISMYNHCRQKYMLSSLGSLKYFKLTKRDFFFNFIKLNYLLWLYLKLVNAKRIDFTDGWNFQYYSEQLQNLDGNYMIRGCLAHPTFFFADYENIKQYFQVKAKYRHRFETLHKDLFNVKKVVVIHIRRGDYIQFQIEGLGDTNMSLPVSYYKRIINLFNENEVNFVFLSDDIVQVKQDFGYLENAYFSEENEITDLQLLMHADVCILSCSTFSWWGAALNSNPDKAVYVPKYFLGFKIAKEYPEKIIPDDWIKVDVYDGIVPPFSIN